MFSRPIAVLVAFLLIPAAPLAAQQAERRWVVDNSVGTSGDGSADAPFLTLAEAVEAAEEGETIGVNATETPYAGGITLRSGQSLRGLGGTPVITAAEGAVVGVTGASGAIAIDNVILRATGAANGIAVRDSAAVVTLSDVQIATAGGTGLSAARTAKLIVAGKSSIESIDGPAVHIEETELDVVLAGVTARGDKLAHGIILKRTTGLFTVEEGTIEGASARAVSAIEATGVTLRQLRLIRNANVNGTTPADCGSDLASGSNEKCNAAVYLHTVGGATLENVVVEGSGQAGLVAHRVEGLAVSGSTFRNAGDELYEHGLILEELTGECRISETTVERSASRHLMLHNSAGRLSLTIEKSAFSETGTPHGQQGVLVTASGDAAVDLTVRDSAFSRTFSHALDVTASDRAKLAVRVTGSTFERNASAVNLAITQAARIDYVIADNPSITHSENTAINLYLGAPSTGVISGTIARNTIGKSGAARSGTGCDSCNGITLNALGHGKLIADVNGNIIQQVGASAISATATQGAAELHLTAVSNLLREGGSAAPAIRVQSGARLDAANVVCADLKNNTIQGAWEPNGAIHLVHRFPGARLQLAGLTEGKSEEAAAAAVAARNGGVKVRAALRPETTERGFEPAERCTMPALN